ncbi:hypothetical protein F4703DRAFT_1973657 [Phycomyces blakesleeanus]
MSPTMTRSWTGPDQRIHSMQPIKKDPTPSRPLRSWCITALSNFQVPLIRGRVGPAKDVHQAEETKPNTQITDTRLPRSYTVAAQISNISQPIAITGSIDFRSPPSHLQATEHPLPCLTETSQQTNIGISDLIRRLTRTSTLSRNNTTTTVIHDNKYQAGRPHWLHTKQGTEIYLTSPYVVAGGQLTGTVIIKLNPSQPQMDYLEGLVSLQLNFYGVEAITDTAHFSPASHTCQFLRQNVLSAVHSQIYPRHLSNNKQSLVIPFTAQLPVDLSGSYKDKKGMIRYYLERKPSQNPSTYATLRAERPIELYSNSSLGTLGDAALYVPVVETRQVWRTPSCQESCVNISLALSRTLWVSGSPIYAVLKTNNESKQKITNVKIELLRRQNTFSQTGLTGSFEFMPVTSTCEVIAQTSLASLDWWRATDESTSNQVTLVVEAPPNQCSVKNQTLIDVSFALRLSLACPTSTDAVLETPVTLVHPISMDPPPNIYEHKSHDIQSVQANIFLRHANERQLLHKTLFIAAGNNSSVSTLDSISSLSSDPYLGLTIDTPTIGVKNILNRSRKSISSLEAHSLPMNHQHSSRTLSFAPSPNIEKIRYGQVSVHRVVEKEESVRENTTADLRHQLGLTPVGEAMQGYMSEFCASAGEELAYLGLKKDISSSHNTDISYNSSNDPFIAEWQGKDIGARGLKRMVASSSRYMRALRSKSMQPARKASFNSKRPNQPCQ